MLMKLTCETCGQSFERSLSHARGRTFCSRDCAYSARRKTTRKARRMVYRPAHPLANRQGYISQARAVLFDAIGNGPHPCHWCGKAVNWIAGKRGVPKGALAVDHVNRDSRDDKRENLVPSCQSCNTFRSREQRHRISSDELSLPNGQSRVRAEQRVCRTCGNPFLFAPSKDPRPNAGRYCSRVCLWRRPN